MAIGTVCNREVVIAERGLPVLDAARLMRQHHVGDLVVVEEMRGGRRPVGIVTDRDLVVEVLAAAVSPETLTLGDIMGQELATVGEHEGVFESMRYMRTKGVRRMPVLDREGWLVGIVTLDDLLALLAEEMNEMARLIGRERNREQQSRR